VPGFVATGPCVTTSGYLNQLFVDSSTLPFGAMTSVLSGICPNDRFSFFVQPQWRHYNYVSLVTHSLICQKSYCNFYHHSGAITSVLSSIGPSSKFFLCPSITLKKLVHVSNNLHACLTEKQLMSFLPSFWCYDLCPLIHLSKWQILLLSFNHHNVEISIMCH